MALTKIDDRGLKTPIDLLDNEKIRFGTGNDLELFHDGTSSYIKNTTNDLVIWDDSRVRVRTPSLMVNNAGDTENLLIATENGSVELYYDNSKKFNTMSSGVAVTGAIDVANGSIYLRDNYKYQCGLGNDLQIYHDGSNSFIANTTGNLIIEDNSGTIYLQSTRIDIESEDGEQIAHFISDGGVKLYYDNSEKFRTNAGGAQVFGNLTLGDNKKLFCGDSNDLQIYHDGTGCNIRSTSSKLEIRSPELLLQNSGAEKYFRGVSDGAVELYHDNSKKLTTYSTGVEIHGSEGENCELYLYADEGDDDADNWKLTTLAASSTYQLRNRASGSWETNIECNGNGNVELYYDNAKKLQTQSGGVRVYGDLENHNNNFVAKDNCKYTAGNSEDLQIYHNGSHNYINSTTDSQNLYLSTVNGSISLQPVYGVDHGILIQPNNDVELYYDGSKKLETTSSGITVTGSVTETSDVSLKNDINTIQNPLELIEQIRGINFTWKNNGMKSMGVIAQDVEKVFPELVHGQEGSKTLQYSGLIGALVESVKELSAKVAALEAG